MDDRSGAETREMEHLVSEQRKNRIISGEIAVTSKQTAKLDKKTTGLIIALISGVVLFILSQFINIYFKYEKMIRGIDKHKPSNWQRE